MPARARLLRYCRVVKLAYLGPRGSFGEVAAHAFSEDAELVPLPSHAGVVAAVSAKMADAGVLPVENSVEGSVNETLDLLIHDTELLIGGEVVVPIEQCLLVRPGTTSEGIQVIFSHPQALGQCRAFIERCFPRARLEATLSTSAGVEALASRPDAAAIASARAAEVFGATLLARAIQDRRNNETRFVTIGARESSPTGNDKTSIAFKTPHDRPGTLLDVLSEFSSRGINLTKIESRPSKDALGVYVFLLDFEGHRSDASAAEALERVREKTSWLRLLGSYPSAAAPK